MNNSIVDDQFLPDDMDDDTFGFGNSPGNEDNIIGNGRTNAMSHQSSHRPPTNDPTELNTEQKLQLAERANEIYRQQLKYMQDHLASLRSLIQDKENIIENLMLRFDLGIITQDQNRQSGNLTSDEIENNELRRKAEALAQRTILENFELREMVNELRDENFHLRNEIYELQDKINRQVLQINKLEKANNQHMQALQLALQQVENTPGNDDDSSGGGKQMISGDDNTYGGLMEDDDDEDNNMNGMQYEEEDKADTNIYDVDEYADDQPIPPHDQTGRRLSKSMDHPANTEEARAERVKRETDKHHRKVSSAMPPDYIRTMNDSTDEEDDSELDDDEIQGNVDKQGKKRRGSKHLEYELDDEARAKQEARKKHHRRESSAATPNMFSDNYDPEKEARIKAKKYTPEAIQKRNIRKAKRVAQAAQNHVVSHRRKQSLVEKLLLGIDDEDDPDLEHIRDPEKREQMRKEAQKHQRRKSRQLIQNKVGDKGHLSDEDAKDMDEEKAQRYDFKARREMKRAATSKAAAKVVGDLSNLIGHKKRPSIGAEDQNGDGVVERHHHRRDSSSPTADLGFKDADVLLNFEKLKVADLEKELEKTKNMLDNTTTKMNTIQNSVKNVQLRTETAEAECVKSQEQLKHAIHSKSELAQKCAMEMERLTLVLNTLLQIPKFKNTVQMLVEESYRAKTGGRNGLI